MERDDAIEEQLFQSLEPYNDVIEYIKSHQHHVRAGDNDSFPWPPVNKRLRYKAQDAYLLEDVARYKFKIKTPRVTKHQDLKEKDGVDEYREWFNLPGRRDLYNLRKDLKAEADKERPKVGLDAATNPFAPKEAKEKEKTIAEKRKAACAQIKSKAPAGRFIEGSPLAERLLDHYMEGNAHIHFLCDGDRTLTVHPESEGATCQLPKKPKTMPAVPANQDEPEDAAPYTQPAPSAPPRSGRTLSHPCVVVF